eukprot:g3606.t1
MSAHPPVPPGLGDEEDVGSPGGGEAKASRRPTVKMFHADEKPIQRVVKAHGRTRSSVSSVESDFSGTVPPGLEEHASAVDMISAKGTDTDEIESERTLGSEKSSRSVSFSMDDDIIREVRRKSLENAGSRSMRTITTDDGDASIEEFEKWSKTVKSFLMPGETKEDKESNDGEDDQDDDEDTLQKKLVERLTLLGEMKQKYEVDTQEMLAEKIRNFDKQIRDELTQANDLKRRFDGMFDLVKKWATPVYMRRTRLVSECHRAAARVRGLQEGLAVQTEGMKNISKLAREQIEATKEKIKRVHRNTDALARSLGVEKSTRAHNQYLELSIYLWRKFLSEATQASTQASAELTTKSLDIEQFKTTELTSLLHQSNIELKLLSENVERENQVLGLEYEKAKSVRGKTSEELDAEHAEALSDLLELQRRRDATQNTAVAVENRLQAMKRRRQILEREFQELAIALRALWPSNTVTVNIAEQQLRQIESVDRQRKKLQSAFRERLDTAMAETKLSEEIKWRNRQEVSLRDAERAILEYSITKKEELEVAVSDVGNKFQDQFEDRVAKLRLEKEEHARLGRVRSSRLEELQRDFERIQDMKKRIEDVHDQRLARRHRLQALKERFRQRWHQGHIKSEGAEKFLLRVQWTMDFTPEMIERCRENMHTLRVKLPLIRSCRADIRQRNRVLGDVLQLQHYIANPEHPEEATIAALRRLDLALPNPRGSAGAQHLEFEALNELLKQTYEDLTSELDDLDRKLLSDIDRLESTSNGYIFVHRGLEYKEVVRRQEEIVKRPVRWAQWEKKCRSMLPKLRGRRVRGGRSK